MDKRSSGRGTAFRWVGLSSLLFSLGLVLARSGAPIESILARSYRWDTPTMVFTAALLVIAIVSLLFSLHETLAWEGEWVATLLCAVVGGCLAIGATDFISLFVSLELFGLSTYILVGLQKGNRFTMEAAWKYLITGGVATAVFLYGVSFMVGPAGETGFSSFYTYILVMLQSGAKGSMAWILFSFFLIFIGLALKLALVPFHLWAPDVYRGSGSPMLVWLLVGVKVTLLAVLFRLATLVYQPVLYLLSLLGYRMVPWLIFGLALLTILVGNVASLFQKRVKGAFAFASLAQGGYFLLPFSNNQPIFESVSPLVLPGGVSLLVYVVAYALVVFGGLAIIETVTSESGSEDVGAFAGLIHRSPVIALSMTGLLLSAAGVPLLTAGFFAKFYLLLNVMEHDSYRAMLFLLVTLFSYLAYFRILRQIFFRRCSVDFKRMNVPWNLSFVITVSVAGTLLLGFFPGGVSRFIDAENWVRSGSLVSNESR